MYISNIKIRSLLLASFWLTVFGCKTGTDELSDKNWWQTTAYYQIYPRSFQDSDGDGIGDLNGIKNRLEHISELGIGAIWISPIYPSPMADFGYDISNFTDIDPMFGTLEDFDDLMAKAKGLGIRVILDFVPNHSSDEHEWFKKSVKREDPYTNYYVWMDGKDVDETGELEPPNNWIAAFQGSAWKWNEERGQYYLHQFVDKQPDLNYRDPNLRKEMENVLKFWIERGVAGFRIDAINMMFEDESFADEPLSNNPLPDPLPEFYDPLNHTLTRDQPETYEVLKSWRELLDAYSEETNTDRKVLMTEGYTSLDLVLKYFDYGSNIPFNFRFITEVNGASTAANFRGIIEDWVESVPEGNVPNWVVGNHDQRRVASRYGEERADQMSIVCMILPGVSVSFNGDEIGMLDGDISWQDSRDPAACNTNENNYQTYTRDPERTPFQWDATPPSAGFSTNASTWLPVNPNYVTLNLAAQKSSTHSHFHVYKAMTKLRAIPILKRGELTVRDLQNNVLLIARTVQGAPPVFALVNCADTQQSVNLANWNNVPESLTVYTASISSNIIPGSKVQAQNVNLPAAATLVLTTQRLYEILNGEA